MKKIFRFANIGLLLAAILVLGAVAAAAQDPCSDADKLNSASDKVRAAFTDYAKASSPERHKTINMAKDFLTTYGTCEAAKELSDYVNKYLPSMEKGLKVSDDKDRWDAVLAHFNSGMKTRNWDDVYSAGKQILNERGDDFRQVELVLGSIGLDETAKTPRVTKWNDDTIRYAKQSIQDLEAGKKFSTYGVSIKDGANFTYKSKDDAIGWMNYTIGYIYYYDKNNKAEAVNYLYKATQANSDTQRNPVIYQTIGNYFAESATKLGQEHDDLVSSKSPSDTVDVAKQKDEAIKAKAGMFNGTAEAAIDAYARAYNLSKADAKQPKSYTDGLYKTIQGLYNVRFGKMDGMDVWVANSVKNPMTNPSLPIKPIMDPEPATTTNNTPPANIKPPVTSPPGKPPVKPGPAPGKTPGTKGKVTVRNKTRKQAA